MVLLGQKACTYTLVLIHGAQKGLHARLEHILTLKTEFTHFAPSTYDFSPLSERAAKSLPKTSSLGFRK